MITEEVLHDRSKRFVHQLERYVAEQVDQMFQRLEADLFEPGMVYFIGGVPATPEQEAMHEQIMKSSAKPRTIMSYGEWQLSSRNKEGK